MKQIWRKITAFFTTSVVTVALSGCGGKEDRQSASPIPVLVTTVHRDTVPEKHRYAAELQPAQLAMLRFRSNGYVAFLRDVRDPATKKMRILDVGDSVPAGAVLASLRRVEFTNGVVSAQAATEQARHSAQSTADKVRQAEAQLANDEINYKRAQNLFAAGAMTGQDYDRAKSQYESSMASRDSGRKELSASEDAIRQNEAEETSKRLDLADSALKAPFPGVVVSRNVNIGDYASSASSQEAFRFGDIRFVKAVFFVPASEVAQLHLGGQVDVHLPQNADLPVRGKIDLISTVADQQSRLFRVQVVIPNPERKLLVGTTGSLELETAINVPQISVLFTALSAANADTKGYTVFVVQQDGGHSVTRLRKIYLVSVAGDQAIVTGDIKENEQVVDRPSEQLRDGSVVSTQRRDAQ